MKLLYWITLGTMLYLAVGIWSVRLMYAPRFGEQISSQKFNYKMGLGEFVLCVLFAITIPFFMLKALCIFIGDIMRLK